MEDGRTDEPEGEGRINVAAQAAAAGVLVVAALGAMWGLGVFGPANTGPAKAASCEAKPSDPPEYRPLCSALNRPDLPTLLGAPTQPATLAYSAGGTSSFADGTKQTDVAVEMQLGEVSVRLSDEQGVAVKDLADAGTLLGTRTTSTKVLGHPAVTYSERTLAINLGGGAATPGHGGIARHLVVAKSALDGGGVFELVLWRQDDLTPDDAALLRIAEHVLPTAPGWIGTP